MLSLSLIHFQRMFCRQLSTERFGFSNKTYFLISLLLHQLNRFQRKNSGFRNMKIFVFFSRSGVGMLNIAPIPIWGLLIRLAIASHG